MSSRLDTVYPIPLTKERMSKFVLSLIDTVEESFNKTVHKHNTSLHIAFLVSRGKIISVGTNSIGSRIKGCCYGDRSLHAEMAALKNVHWSKIGGADMYIFRWKPSIKNISLSHPCDRCMQVLNKFSRERSLNRVYYSLDNEDALCESSPTFECCKYKKHRAWNKHRTAFNAITPPPKNQVKYLKAHPAIQYQDHPPP
jgi:hypothetical protein